MGIETGISWTDHTFNIAWGCHKVSPACTFCYAEVWAKRMGNEVWGLKAPRKTFGIKHWNQPIKWNKNAIKEGKRKRVFCSSMCDVFEDHPTIIQELTKLWPLIKATPMLDWQLLTKRADRIALSLPDDWGDGYENVWLGTTIENNDYVDRADALRAIPVKVRFISYEPALGPLDKLDLSGLHWIIYGGESGPHRRPEDFQWARDMNTRCNNSGVAFYFKQSSGLKPGTNPQLDGVTYYNFPLDAE